MKVLSLFDGMSCGQIALDQLGIPVETYYASEIDKYAIQVTQANYPNTIQVGDVCNLNPKDFADVNLIMGGSPCQGFSFAGKQLAFDDPRSALFFEFIRLLKAIKPKYFLLENVRMKKEYLQVISEQVSACYPEIPFGIEPIFINSSLVSAQSRQRYYWTNIPNIKQPEDRGIVLRDILVTEPKVDKSYRKVRAETATSDNGITNIKKGTSGKSWFFERQTYSKDSKKTRPLMAGIGSGNIPKVIETKPIKLYDIPREILKDNERQRRVYSVEGKSPTVLARSDSTKISTPKQVGSIKDGGQGNRIYSQDGKSSTLSAQSGGTAGSGNTLVETKPKQVGIVNKKVNLKKYNDEIAINPRNFGGKGYVGTDEKSVALTQPSGNNATLVRVNEKAIRETKPKQVGMAADIKGHDILKRVYSPEGKSPTLNSMGGGNREPKVAINNLPDKSQTIKSQYYKSSRANFENDTSKGGKFSATGVQQEDLTWRKLTPLECERLQTVPDNYTNHVSNTQRYKMLGNGWTVEVIKHILKNVR